MPQSMYRKRCSCGSPRCMSKECLAEENEPIIEEEEPEILEELVELIEPELSEQEIHELKIEPSFYERPRSLTPVPSKLPSLRSPIKESSSLLTLSSPVRVISEKIIEKEAEPSKVSTEEIIEEEPEEEKEDTCACTFKDGRNELMQRYIEHFQRNKQYTKHIQRLLGKKRESRANRNVCTMFDSTCGEEKCRKKKALQPPTKYNCPSQGWYPNVAPSKHDHCTSMSQHMQINGSQDGSTIFQYSGFPCLPIRYFVQTGAVPVCPMNCQAIQKPSARNCPPTCPRRIALEMQNLNNENKNCIISEKLIAQQYYHNPPTGGCKCCTFCRTQKFEKPQCLCGTYNNGVIIEEPIAEELTDEEQISPEPEGGSKLLSTSTYKQSTSGQTNGQHESITVKNSQVVESRVSKKKSSYRNMSYNQQYFTPMGQSTTTADSDMSSNLGSIQPQSYYNIDFGTQEASQKYVNESKNNVGPPFVSQTINVSNNGQIMSLQERTSRENMSSGMNKSIQPQSYVNIDFGAPQVSQKYVNGSKNNAGTPIVSQTLNGTLNVSNNGQIMPLQQRTSGSPNKMQSSFTSQGINTASIVNNNIGQSQEPITEYNGNSNNVVSSGSPRRTNTTSNGTAIEIMPSHLQGSVSPHGGNAAFSTVNNYFDQSILPLRINNGSTRTTPEFIPSLPQGTSSPHAGNSGFSATNNNSDPSASARRTYTGSNHIATEYLQPPPQANMLPQNGNSGFNTGNNSNATPQNVDTGSNHTATDFMQSPPHGSIAPHAGNSGLSAGNNPNASLQRTDTGINRNTAEYFPSPPHGSISPHGGNSRLSAGNNSNALLQRTNTGINSNTAEYFPSPPHESIAPHAGNSGLSAGNNPNASLQRTDTGINRNTAEYFPSLPHGSISPHGRNSRLSAGSNPNALLQRTNTGINRNTAEYFPSPPHGSVTPHGENSGLSAGNNPNALLQRTNTGINRNTAEYFPSPPHGSVTPHAENSGFSAGNNPNVSFQRPDTDINRTTAEYFPSPPQGSIAPHAGNSGYSAANDYVNPSAVSGMATGSNRTTAEYFPSPPHGSISPHGRNSGFSTGNDPNATLQRIDDGSSHVATENIQSPTRGSMLPQGRNSGFSASNNQNASLQRTNTGIDRNTAEYFPSPPHGNISPQGGNSGYSQVNNYVVPSASPKRMDTATEFIPYPPQGIISPHGDNSGFSTVHQYVDPSALPPTTHRESNRTTIEFAPSPPRGTITPHEMNSGFSAPNNYVDPYILPQRTNVGSNGIATEFMPPPPTANIASHAINSGLNNTVYNPVVSPAPNQIINDGTIGTAPQYLPHPPQPHIAPPGMKHGFSPVPTYVDSSTSPLRINNESNIIQHMPFPQNAHTHGMDPGFSTLNHYIDSYQKADVTSNRTGHEFLSVPDQESFAPYGMNAGFNPINGRKPVTTHGIDPTTRKLNTLPNQQLGPIPEEQKGRRPRTIRICFSGNCRKSSNIMLKICKQSAKSLQCSRNVVKCCQENNKYTRAKIIPRVKKKPFPFHKLISNESETKSMEASTVGTITMPEIVTQVGIDEYETNTGHCCECTNIRTCTAHADCDDSEKEVQHFLTTMNMGCEAPCSRPPTCNPICNGSCNKNQNELTTMNMGCTGTCSRTLTCNPTCNGSCNKHQNDLTTMNMGCKGTCSMILTCNPTCHGSCNKNQNDHTALNMGCKGPCSRPPTCNPTCNGMCNKNQNYLTTMNTGGEALSSKSPRCNPTCKGTCNKNQNDLTTMNMGCKGLCSRPPTCNPTCNGSCNKNQNYRTTMNMGGEALCYSKPPTCNPTCKGTCNKNQNYPTTMNMGCEAPSSKPHSCNPTCNGSCNNNQNEQATMNMGCKGPCSRPPTCNATCKGICNKNQNYLTTMNMGGKAPSSKPPRCNPTCNGSCNKNQHDFTTMNMECKGSCSKPLTCNPTCNGICNKNHNYLTTMNMECDAPCSKPPTCNPTCNGFCNPSNQLPPPCKMCNGPKYCINIHHPFQSFYPNIAVQVSSMDLLHGTKVKEKVEIMKMHEVKVEKIIEVTPKQEKSLSNNHANSVLNSAISNRFTNNTIATDSNDDSDINKKSEPEVPAAHRPTPPKTKRFGSNYRMMRNAVTSEMSTERFKGYPRSNNEIGDMQSDYNFSDMSGDKFKSQGFSGDSRDSRRVSLRYDFPVFEQSNNPSMMGSTTSVEERIRNLRQNMEKLPDGSESGGSNRSQNTVQSIREGRIAMVEDDEDSKPILRRSMAGGSQTYGRKTSRR